MPHIILEVSQDFDIEIAKDIIDESQKFLVENLPTKLETFKSRVYRYVYASVAGANLKELVHLQIKVLSGRKQEHLQNLSKTLQTIIKDKLNNDKYNVTLEIIELSPAYAN